MQLFAAQNDAATRGPSGLLSDSAVLHAKSHRRPSLQKNQELPDERAVAGRPTTSPEEVWRRSHAATSMALFLLLFASLRAVWNATIRMRFDR